MATIEYSLFRTKFIKPAQRSFLHEDHPASDLFLMSINERPSAMLRPGFTWHVGNIREFDADTGYFAVGRTTTATIEKFDESTGNFIEEELATSPYTHCVYNAAIGFVGIAKKNALGGSAKAIAAILEKLLAGTKVILQNEVSVEIPPIPDPDGFIRAISNAYRVTKFAATFRGPNPFDADAHFQRPLSVYLAEANGTKGKAQIQGDDLNRTVIKEVARSTAATGNEASARITKARGQKALTVNLRGDPLKRRYDELDHQPETVLADLTNLYHHIRSND